MLQSFRTSTCISGGSLCCVGVGCVGVGCVSVVEKYRNLLDVVEILILVQFVLCYHTCLALHKSAASTPCSLTPGVVLSLAVCGSGVYAFVILSNCAYNASVCSCVLTAVLLVLCLLFYKYSFY